MIPNMDRNQKSRNIHGLQWQNSDEGFGSVSWAQLRCSDKPSSGPGGRGTGPGPPLHPCQCVPAGTYPPLIDEYSTIPKAGNKIDALCCAIKSDALVSPVCCALRQLGGGVGGRCEG